MPQSCIAREKSPKWSQMCSKHWKAPCKLPDNDLLSRPNGIRYCKSGNASSNARIIHFRESVDLPLLGVPHVHLLQKWSTMCINKILQQNFSIIISGESPVNFSLAIICDNSYLKENIIFRKKKSKFYQMTRDKLRTGLLQCINRCFIG